VQKLFEMHREMMRRRSEEGFEGFTLIELLIVIVVIGILAATVIFALGGVTSQSAVAACKSDAKSIEVAVEAYHSFPGNATNSYPGTMQDLMTGVGGSGAFLHALPNNSAYTITLYNDTGAPAGAKAGHVYVQPTGTGSASVDYDTEANPGTLATGGCNAAT
jgi:general secretion pathway protein G